MAKNYFSGCYSVLLESWEQEAYAGGYGADWLENIAESVLMCNHSYLLALRFLVWLLLCVLLFIYEKII